jgi:PTS system mannitol-specific IIA component
VGILDARRRPGGSDGRKSVDIDNYPGGNAFTGAAAVMEILTKEMVRLGAQATDKTDAIKQSGELLVQAGCVAPAYVDGMLARERVMSNYLGNGVAIPHGELKDLALVYRTGVSVLQLPEGVEWEPGEKAHLVVGLAATSDELVDILSNLLEVLQEPGSIELLAHTTDPMVIVERLARSPGERQADAKHRAPF